jgi:phage shock protein A
MSGISKIEEQIANAKAQKAKIEQRIARLKSEQSKRERNARN